MAKLPTDLSAKDPRRALERIGFVQARQRGSHMILKRGQPPWCVVVPNHKRLRPGTLPTIIHEADLSIDELLRRLQ